MHQLAYKAVALSALAAPASAFAPSLLPRAAAVTRCRVSTPLLHNAVCRVASRSRALQQLHMSTETGTEDSSAPPAAPVGELTELARLEMRVGKIVEVGRHPDADGLYVEKIDIGEPAGPRTIVSGLVAYCTQEELLNRDVVILANLKPVNMRGVESAGMVLCSSNADHTRVAPLVPPEGTPLGELVTFEGHQAAPVDAGNRAVKAWKKVAKTVSVGEDGVARFTDEALPAAFMTSKGAITSPLPGNIS